MDWEFNAVLIPKTLVDDWLSGTTTDADFLRLLKSGLTGVVTYPAPQPTVKVEVPTDWLIQLIADRLPGVQIPTTDKLEELWEKASKRKEVIEALLVNAADYHSRTKINSLAGFLIRQLDGARGDFRSILAQAEQLVRAQQTDPNSIVGETMKRVENQIAKLPPKTAPNAVKVAKLVALTAK